MTDSPAPSEQDRERREAKVLSRHLPDGYSAEPDALGKQHDRPSSSRPRFSQTDSDESEEESSLKLQGGDIHRDLFKKTARNRLQQRAATFSHSVARPRRSSDPRPNTSDQGTDGGQGPGSFRRQFVRQQYNRGVSYVTPVTKNFVDFLDLYGGFAGEDLAESDDEDGSAVQDEEQHSSESRPLLGRRQSSRRANKAGDASTSQTFFTLVKAFIGTGIMFLPKAFSNGGLVFSCVTMIIISLLSCVCFHLLLTCRAKYGGGYGELGGEIGGPKFRTIILASITISQIGFVCAGLIFTAENLLQFSEAMAGGDSPMSTAWLIAIQVAVLVPLSFIRNMSKLGGAALLADVFILIGITYIYWFDIKTLSSNGIAPSVTTFNKESWTLTIGSAIFTFEGIGLILPIQSSMKQPEHFSKLLYGVMAILTVVFTSVGVLCYLTFGIDTNVEIISNFPQSSKLVNAIQFLYSLAILVGAPVQLFPAIRIIEGKLFGHLNGKKSASAKWKKNAFRTCLVGLCAGIAIAGASDLDKFVALIGSFACIPLVYIYPAVMHYKGIAESRLERGIDLSLIVIGVVGCFYTTAITVQQWITS